MRFLTLSFFHQSTHPRVLIHGLKPFRIWLQICQEIQNILLQCSASAVSMRPRKRLWRFQWDCRILKKTLFFLSKVVLCWKFFKKFDFRGLNETSEVDSEVSMRLQKQIQQYQWECGSGFSSVNMTAEALAKTNISSQFH
jgi:hypothetical protein